MWRSTLFVEGGPLGGDLPPERVTVTVTPTRCDRPAVPAVSAGPILRTAPAPDGAPCGAGLIRVLGERPAGVIGAGVTGVAGSVSPMTGR